MQSKTSNRKLIADVMIVLMLCGIIVHVSVVNPSIWYRGAFSGVVYASIGVSISGAMVMATSSEGYGIATTNSLGQYSINEGLKTGNYTVSIIAQGYLCTETENVSVTAGMETSGIDFYLELSGGISGKVTDALSGLPLQNIFVTAFMPANSSYSWSALTDLSGDYQIATNLATGTYNVSVLFPEGYAAKTISGVSVTVGVMTAGVNLALDRSGIISGRVTATPSGSPLEDATITAASDDAKYFGYAQTNATGHYRITSGLGTGNYTVMAMYDLSVDFTDVSVVAGSETPHVDFEFEVTPQPSSGIITGKVTDIEEEPIVDALVIAQGPGYGQDYTDEDGEYVISSGLESGAYTVSAQASGYLPQNITGVNVIEDQVTPNINLQLSRIPTEQSGIISGTVQGDQNPIPEFQCPTAVLLIVALVTVILTKLRKIKTRNT